MAANLDIECDLSGDYTDDERGFVERELRKLRDRVETHTYIDCGLIGVREIRGAGVYREKEL